MATKSKKTTHKEPSVKVTDLHSRKNPTGGARNKLNYATHYKLNYLKYKPGGG